MQYYNIITDYIKIRNILTYRESQTELDGDKKPAYNIACSFDIETTSFYEGADKRATMYVWQMCIDGIYIIGRTWADFVDMMLLIDLVYKRGDVYIYVHNLSYEFEWIYPYLDGVKVFARKPHAVIYAKSRNVVFKCSYFLVNYKLSTLAKIRGYTDKKTMDYHMIRTYETELTNDEIDYILTDVKIIYELITEEIGKNGGIKKIPLTQTGYIRRYCLDRIREQTDFSAYRRDIKNIFPSDMELFDLLYDGFAGGYVHANATYISSEITAKNFGQVWSYDFNSHYPAVMCRKKYPRRFHRRDPSAVDIEHTDMAYIATIHFVGLRATTSHSIISCHKCNMTHEEYKQIADKYGVDNGRLRGADDITITITDLDYKIISKYYTWDSYEVIKIYTAVYEYLPRELIIAILDLYRIKTELKGIPERYDEYLNAKQRLNAIFGMAVTNPLNDDITFDPTAVDKWGVLESDYGAKLSDERDKYNLFLAYQYGVWVTAWGRYELLNMVYDIDTMSQYTRVVYCDTDSIKLIGDESIRALFDRDNERIIAENEQVIKYYNLSRDLFFPRTIEGKTKPLGIWDFEGVYNEFKTLGSKRYVYIDDSGLHCTISGVSKHGAALTMTRNAIIHNTDIISEFCNNLTIAPGRAGKMCHTYIDRPYQCVLTDYQGHHTRISEHAYIHLEEIGYSMSMSRAFIDFLTRYEHNILIGGKSTWAEQKQKNRGTV